MIENLFALIYTVNFVIVAAQILKIKTDRLREIRIDGWFVTSPEVAIGK